ncbi:MAG: UrcA family protein [Alphaproteobacteria bacterium]|nr:UrcA family protein [Alphaproteobacteria bacterium]
MLLRSTTALLIALSAAASVQAQNVRSEVIEYVPATLTSEAGYNAIAAEIRAAARRVCDFDSVRGAAQARAARICYEEAIAHAFGQINDEVAEQSSVQRVFVR